MKTFLLTIIIFAILIIPASAMQAPPLQIIIWEEKELIEMRRMAMAEEVELIDYLRRANYFVNGMKSREDVISFLKLLDSLPIPYETGMQFSSLTYYLDSEYQTFSIRFSSETGERYSFSLSAAEDKGKSAFEESLNGEQLVEIFRSQENGKQIIVYSSPTSWGSFFPMNINGHFIRAGYNPGDSGITDITPENIYGDMRVTSFAEAPWSTINTVEDEPISFTTAEALMILRAVAGVAALTEEEAARFEISGAPATADAMRILRVVAGLHA